MTIILTDAAHDENGKDGYEKHLPGDQTGDEVRNITYAQTTSFWNNAKTVVLRCKREDMANAIAIRMQQLKDNPRVGYGQPGRRGVYEQLSKDPDPSHIGVDIDCDCSSAVNTCVWVTFKTCNHPETHRVNALARTADMPAMYAKISEFEFVTDKIDLATGDGLQRGDILVIPGSHTACVWEVKEDDPVISTDPNTITGLVTTEVNLRTAPSALAQKCKIQMSPGSPIRNTLKKGEKVKIIGEQGNWYQIEINGVHTWYPWVTKSAVKKA